MRDHAGNGPADRLDGRYRVRIARGDADLDRALTLRGSAFRRAGSDRDRFDALFSHLLVEDRESGATLGTLRYLPLADGSRAESGYSAQFYDLSRLARLRAPLIEIGRFCVAGDRLDPDVLRLAWAGLARIVEAEGAALLFGCSSFAGADPLRHAAGLSMLGRFRAPERYRVLPRAADRVPIPPDPEDGPAASRLPGTVPPLLRSYLSMGGWVGDHAVIDRDMDTLHVFTGLAVSAIPPARARLLRLAAARLGPL